MVQTKKRSNYNSYETLLRKNAVALYLKEIDKTPLLTREEEVELARKAAKGDKVAKEKLVVSNLRFVVSIAKKYRHNGIPLSDLISEGNIGLLNAVERFDYTRGYHFISYAVWWIKQAIMKAVSEKSRMVRLPMNRTNELMQIGKFIEKHSKETGKRPSTEVIAREMDMDKNEIRKLMDMSSAHSSIEDMLSESINSDNPHTDFSLTDDSSLPDEAVIRSSLKENIDKVLSRLPERERNIIEYRFGLNGKEPQSLSKIGAMLNLTKERIRQIEKMAMDQIRASADSQFLYAYIN